MEIAPAGLRRVAVLCMHTSPLHQPGGGDGGGLNVYVRELTAAMAHLGTECDIYTRRTDPAQPDHLEIEPGVRLTHIDAGAPSLDKADLPAVVGTFADRVADHLIARPAEALHSHYWLSGMAGHDLKHRLGLPLAVTFHTLGRIKAANGDAEPRHRGNAEQRIIDCADAVFTSGQAEARQLCSHYDVAPNRVHLLIPGVNGAVFTTGQRSAARAEIGLPDGPMLLFVGRLQPLKGADIAIETLAATRAAGGAGADSQLVVVGGPSGDDGLATADGLRRLAGDLGVSDHVRFVDPLPHRRLAAYYRAADVCLVPSRSESFGLVASEAAACGAPVVAADVGGLRDNVVHGETGFLVDRRDGEAFARRVREILEDPLLGLRLGEAGARRAERFSWRVSANAALAVLGTTVRRDLVACV